MIYPELMPTNKLWIEHTERAAWDSVEALRERLAQAENRLQALTPGVTRVAALLDLLEEAKRRYAPDVQTHDEIVARLLARIREHDAERETAKTPELVVMNFSAAPAPPPESEDFAHGSDPTEDEDFDLAGFTQSMQRRAEQAPREPSRDLNRLLALADDKLDELNELEGAALRDAALELAILAAQIHAASRAP
jgi:hypothetical protein